MPNILLIIYSILITIILFFTAWGRKNALHYMNKAVNSYQNKCNDCPGWNARQKKVDGGLLSEGMEE